MSGYDQTQWPPQQKAADGGVAEQRTASSGHAAAAEGALGAALNESSRSQSLMQLRAVLDGSPRVHRLIFDYSYWDSQSNPKGGQTGDIELLNEGAHLKETFM
jgi:hypothetical protein